MLLMMNIFVNQKKKVSLLSRSYYSATYDYTTERRATTHVCKKNLLLTTAQMNDYQSTILTLELHQDQDNNYNNYSPRWLATIVNVWHTGVGIEREGLAWTHHQTLLSLGLRPKSTIRSEEEANRFDHAQIVSVQMMDHPGSAETWSSSNSLAWGIFVGLTFAVVLYGIIGSIGHWPVIPRLGHCCTRIRRRRQQQR